ncbi:MAG: 2-oxo-4-hydroxy-4-carboxy-5-ureidoimidazoline decarboxylase [Candidatus Limnocylindria bacterium]|nr:2-oxo-4-hydroxy-4-carboxy-5-ureidoimidazoline decarboxylase [Candidatus Limnocylindria bacterium]
MFASTETIEAVFERAPVLAGRLRPLVPEGTSPEAIVAAARAIIDSLAEPDRMRILDAHPRIGADPASLSTLSRAEQGGGDDPETLRELAALNDEYERRFGFRFVVFVAGRSKREILPVLRERLRRTRERELAAGLDEFLRISRDRLRRAAG